MIPEIPVICEIQSQCISVHITCLFKVYILDGLSTCINHLLDPGSHWNVDVHRFLLFGTAF